MSSPSPRTLIRARGTSGLPATVHPYAAHAKTATGQGARPGHGLTRTMTGCACPRIAIRHPWSARVAATAAPGHWRSM